MPQMSPLPWLSLFISFILMLMIMNSMNYFYFIPKIYFLKKIFNFKKNFWKW